MASIVEITSSSQPTLSPFKSHPERGGKQKPTTTPVFELIDSDDDEPLFILHKGQATTSASAGPSSSRRETLPQPQLQPDTPSSSKTIPTQLKSALGATADTPFILLGDGEENSKETRNPASPPAHAKGRPMTSPSTVIDLDLIEHDIQIPADLGRPRTRTRTKP
jgi:hypothetical protein